MLVLILTAKSFQEEHLNDLKPMSEMMLSAKRA